MSVFITIIFTFVIVLIAVLLLGINIFFTRKKEFPNIHIGGNKALKQKGIGCATTQDRNAQKENKRMNINQIN